MNTIRESKFYNGKVLWEEFMSLGKAANYRVLQSWCESNGMVNELTGKATKMGVKFAMWRYAVRNPEEAYETYKPWLAQFGRYATFREFCQTVHDHCVSAHIGLVIGVKEKKRFYDKYLRESRESKEIEDNGEHKEAETVA